jgi:hypothetical protein
MTTNSRSLNSAAIKAWLMPTHSSNPNPKYRHTRLCENPQVWPSVSACVEAYFRQSHNDAVERLRRLTHTSLHPAGTGSALPPPYHEYPFGLPPVTLQGYFGETLAGLLAESFSTAGHDDWEVPAHLFHTHVVVFQQLEQQWQSGIPVTAIFGRTGDDCLAFRRDNNRRITSVLFCESKCTCTHQSQFIADAHAKAANSAIVDIMQLVEALEYRNSPEALEWASALRVFHNELNKFPPASVHRCDAVYYVYGRSPKRSETWLSSTGPHEDYTASRSLHAVEVQLTNVLVRVRSIYQAGVWA